MSSGSTAAPATSRSEAVEAVARNLLPRASIITRLLLRRGDAGFSRAEAGILSAIQGGPQRITELASSQALAQPTVTQLVCLLEERGYVSRDRDPSDRRAVLVTLTAAGEIAFEGFRDHYRALLRDHLAGRSDEEVLALANATEILQDVIDALQGDGGR